MLSANMFSKFRNGSLNNYGFIPSHYLRATALIRDVMINIIKVEVEFISDADIYLFFSKVMRSRVSYIPKIYIKAKKKFLKSYDSKQDWKHITYLSARNLCDYGVSISSKRRI